MISLINIKTIPIPQQKVTAFFMLLVIPVTAATKFIARVIPLTKIAITPMTVIIVLYEGFQVKRKNMKIQTMFPGELEYL